MMGGFGREINRPLGQYNTQVAKPDNQPTRQNEKARLSTRESRAQGSSLTVLINLGDL